MNFASFSPPINFMPQQNTPFNEAVRRVGEMRIDSVKKVKDWAELFPCPDFTPSLRRSIGPRGITGKSEREQRLEWEIEARNFLQKCQQDINWQRGRLSYLFEQCLGQWKIDGRPINATPDEIMNNWCRQTEMTTAQFCGAYFTVKMVSPYFVEFAQKWRADRGASEQPGPVITNRERILIYCYEEGMPIAKGHPDYNDYITFATPSKRIAYPNGSLSKLKSLIKSIDKILPLLNSKARKQADNELDTLKLQN